MYNRPLVPIDFVVPDRLQGNEYYLRMLSVDDLDRDLEAVVESADRLKGLFDPDSPWPEGLTKKEDLIDLAWHQREFTIRHSFAYTVVSNDDARCLGCMYIFPSANPNFDAAVYYWVRSGADADSRDAELGGMIRDWLRAAWPFKRVAYPGREQNRADFKSAT